MKHLIFMFAALLMNSCHIDLKTDVTDTSPLDSADSDTDTDTDSDADEDEDTGQREDCDNDVDDDNDDLIDCDDPDCAEDSHCWAR